MLKNNEIRIDFIIDKNNNICNCNEFISNGSCMHITKYNKTKNYLNEINI